MANPQPMLQKPTTQYEKPHSYRPAVFLVVGVLAFLGVAKLFGWWVW